SDAFRFFFFFFQAEDGIRDFHVTGVQTCALPILRDLLGGRVRVVQRRDRGPEAAQLVVALDPPGEELVEHLLGDFRVLGGAGQGVLPGQPLEAARRRRVAQDQVRDAVGVRERVLEGDVAAVGTAGHDDPLVAEVPAQRLEVGNPLSVREGRDGIGLAGPARVEGDHPVLVGERTERALRLGVRAEAGRAVVGVDGYGVALALDVHPQPGAVDFYEHVAPSALRPRGALYR